MAVKGENKCLKMNRATSIYKVDKSKKFVIKPKPGKHSKTSSVSVGYIIKDLLFLADNTRELKYILKSRYLTVDKKIVSDHRLPVGLNDVLEIPKIKKYYKMSYALNGLLVPFEITKEETRYKICKIVSKKLINKNNVQLTTNDGRTIITSNLAYKPKASIKLDLEEGTIKEYYPLEENREVLVIGGKHIGKKGKITKVSTATMLRPMLLKFKDKLEEYETTENNVIVIN
ncbi:MAG: hypothetical protein V1824_03180 [archaeon]